MNEVKEEKVDSLDTSEYKFIILMNCLSPRFRTRNHTLNYIVQYEEKTSSH